MKTQFQVESFLANYTPKSPLDAEFVNSFTANRFQNASKWPGNGPNFDDSPLDVYSFISWFESGLAAFKMAKLKNDIVLLGNVTLQNSETIARLSPEGVLSSQKTTVPTDELKPATEEESNRMKAAMLASGLQPDPKTLGVVPRLNLTPGKRVAFYDYEMNVKGIGVVRSVDDEGEVVFFCYFTYPTQDDKGNVGYNMHELPGCTLESFSFEDLDRENVPTALGNSTSCYRRLLRELEKRGKVWKDKLLRIEPSDYKVDLGAPYWYITDKMKVVQVRDKQTPVARLRYLSGNYFTSHMAAVKMLGKFNDIIRDYLASDSWPEVAGEN